MTTRVIDSQNPIIELVWTGKETPQDVAQANRELQTHIRQTGSPFDLLLDMRSVVAWSQETRSAVVDHQKQLLGWGMRRASVVIRSAVTKLQLNGVKRASLNDRESQWSTYEEALAFLKG